MPVCKNCSSLDSLSWKESLAEDDLALSGTVISPLTNPKTEDKGLSGINEESEHSSFERSSN